MFVRRFGCNPAPEDPRDHEYIPRLSEDEMPNVDLREHCPPVRDQGNLGACSAFGATELFDFVRRKEGLVVWTPSPLFTYYGARAAKGRQDFDGGCFVRDALGSTVNDGVAMERVWPYDETRVVVRPPQEVWDNAEKHQTLEYLKLDPLDRNSYLQCLKEGYPFIFGLTLYSSFMAYHPDGVIPVPTAGERRMGGHCMMCVGYQKREDGSEYVIAQNSWGTGWGDKGYCYIPMEYIEGNDAFDFWTIRTTEVCNEDTEDPKPVVVPPEPPAPVVDPSPVPDPVPTPVVPVVDPTPTPPAEKPKNKLALYIILGISALVLLWMIFF